MAKYVEGGAFWGEERKRICGCGQPEREGKTGFLIVSTPEPNQHVLHTSLPRDLGREGEMEKGSKGSAV